MEAAFFDLDKTVIAKASMVAFGRSLYREGLVSRTLMFRALWGQLVYMHLGASEEKLARMRESVLSLTKGWERERVKRIVVETLEAVVEPIVYAEALHLIDEHRRAGRKVFLVSASPEEIVAPVGRYLRADGVIATRAKVDRDGRYTGETELYAYGPWKAEAMKGLAEERDIDLAASYAYSDSATDIPMLEVVGHAVVVNPDRELARVARERGWEIRQFNRPVRLRDRVSIPSAHPTAAGALVAGAVVGGVVWWWTTRWRGASEPQPSQARPEPRAAAASSSRRR